MVGRALRQSSEVVQSRLYLWRRDDSVMGRYEAIGEGHSSPYYHHTEEFQHCGVQNAFM